MSAKDIKWADIIFAMEPKHEDRLKAGFPRLMNHQTIYVLDIPDEYQYMDPELVKTLTITVRNYLEDG